LESLTHAEKLDDIAALGAVGRDTAKSSALFVTNKVWTVHLSFSGDRNGDGK